MPGMTYTELMQEIGRRLKTEDDAELLSFDFNERNELEMIVRKDDRAFSFLINIEQIKALPGEPVEFLLNMIRGTMRDNERGISNQKSVDISRRLGDV